VEESPRPTLKEQDFHSEKKISKSNVGKENTTDMHGKGKNQPIRHKKVFLPSPSAYEGINQENFATQ